MPGNQEFVRLLAKLGIETSDWKSALKGIKSDLADLAKQEQQKAAVRKKAIADEVVDTKKKITAELEGAKQVTAAAAKHLEALQQQKQAYIEISIASTKLKAQIDLESVSTGTVLKKRQEIVTQCEIEMDKLVRLKYPTESQLQTLRQISAERDKQLTIINRQQVAAQRLTAQTVKQAEAEALKSAKATAAAVKQTVAPETQQIARLKANYSQLGINQEKEKMAIQREIMVILDKQIAAIRTQVNLDRDDVLILNRLAAARSRAAIAAAGGGGGGGGRGGSSLNREEGGFMRGLFGMGAFGTVATGVLTAEMVGAGIRELAKGIKEVVIESGKLEEVTAAFEKLGAVRGVDTLKFLQQLRKASLNMVPDVTLIRLANAALASNLKVSNDQIQQLVHNVAALGLAQGHDPKEAVQALQNSFTTGRFMHLGRTVGIQTTELQMQKFGGSTMPQAVRKQVEFNTILDATNRKMALIGEPTLSFASKLTVLATEFGRVKEAFAEGFQQSPGFQVFMGVLDDLIQKLGDAESFGDAIGEKLGQGLAVAIPVIRNLFGAVKDIISVLGSDGLIGLMQKNLMLGSASGGMFSSLGNILISFTEGVRAAVSGLALLAKAMLLVAGSSSQMLSMNPLSPTAWKKYYTDQAKAVTDFNEWVKKSNQELLDDISKSEEDRAALNKPFEKPKHKVTPGVDIPLGPDLAFETKLQKLRLELTQARAKAELEAVKIQLEGEKEANESAYQQMLITFKQYIDRKKAIREEELKATIHEAEQERDARIQEIAFEERLATIDLKKQVAQAQVGGAKDDATAEEKAHAAEIVRDLQDEVKLTQSTYTIRKQIAEVQFQSKARGAQLSSSREEAQLGMELVKDHLAAVRKGVEAELETRRLALDTQKSMIEDSFKSGLASADAYLKDRKRLIEQEKQLAIDSAYDTYQSSVRNEQNLAIFRLAVAKAEVSTQKELTKLTLSEDDIRLQSISQTYERINKLLETQATIAARPSGQRMLGETQTTAISKVIALNAQYIEQLKIQAALVADQPVQYAKVLEMIAKAQQEQEDYNQKLAEAKDLLTPVGNFLSKLGGELGKFGSHGIRDVGAGLQAGGDTFSQMGSFATGIGAQLGVGSNVFKGVFETGKTAFSALQEQADATKTSVSTINNTLFQFADVLQGVAARIASAFSMSTGDIPHFAEGGPVQKTGPAWVHAGEYVIPAGGMQQIGGGSNALNMMVQSLVAALSTLQQKLVSFTATVSQSTATAGGGLTNIPGIPGQFAPPGSDPLGRSLGLSSPDAPSGGGKIASAFSQSPFGQLQSATKGFLSALSGQGEGNGVGAVKAFTGALSGAIGAVGSFIQATAGASTTTGGAVGGAMSGMSMGSMFGAPGALVGGIAGGIFGGVMGNKAASATKSLNDFKVTFNNLMTQMAENLTGLNQTIQQAEALRQKTANVSTGKSSSAKAQKQQQLDQMDQTLQQLKEKQKQTLQEMQKDLDTLRVPTAYQEWLGGLNSILDTYKKFAEAAQTTKDLANAQQYLTLAVQQWATQQSDTVRQSEIDAINNAIQLNDLYKQRQKLMEDFGKQEQQIMSGGVNIREASASATKAGQLAGLQTDFNQQMDQMNQQIAVAQYKEKSESKIFNLATTKAGLEMQVLGLQDQQIDKQTASTAALQSLLNTVQNTPMSQLSTMPQLLGALGLPYSGPSASQVGPQVGPLTSNAPVYATSNLYPDYPTYPGTTSNPPWVYNGTNAVGGAVGGGAASPITGAGGGTYTAYNGSTSVPIGSAPSALPGWASSPGSVVPSLAGTSGIGSVSTGNTISLGTALSYPGMTQQANMSLDPGQGLAGSGPVVQMGSKNPADLWPSLFPGVAQPGAPVSKSFSGGEASLTVHNNVMHARIKTETAITNAANQRIDAEMKLLAAKKAQTDYDMQHIAALQKLTDSIKSGSVTGMSSAVSSLSGTKSGSRAGTAGIESSLYDLYSERGRYGQGGAAGAYP